MITPAFVATMARYTAWQNLSLYDAADGLDEAERLRGRRAVFGSMQRTCADILWGDAIWISRLSDWPTLRRARRAAGDWIRAWAEALGPGDLDGDLAWHSGAMRRDIVQPMAVCITHRFSHQTHHRGEVHAMLTAAGARPGPTDLIFMPPEAD